MEPCSTILSGKTSCTDRILQSKIKNVIIGPSFFIENCQGVNLLKANGVKTRFVKPDLSDECKKLNEYLFFANKEESCNPVTEDCKRN